MIRQGGDCDYDDVMMLGGWAGGCDAAPLGAAALPPMCCRWLGTAVVRCGWRSFLEDRTQCGLPASVAAAGAPCHQPLPVPSPPRARPPADFGTQINGRIVDSAFTVAFNPRYDPLLAVRAPACGLCVARLTLVLAPPAQPTLRRQLDPACRPDVASLRGAGALSLCLLPLHLLIVRPATLPLMCSSPARRSRTPPTRGCGRAASTCGCATWARPSRCGLWGGLDYLASRASMS